MQIQNEKCNLLHFVSHCGSEDEKVILVCIFLVCWNTKLNTKHAPKNEVLWNNVLFTNAYGFIFSYLYLNYPWALTCNVVYFAVMQWESLNFAVFTASQCFYSYILQERKGFIETKSVEKLQLLNKYIKYHSMTQWHERILLLFAPVCSDNTSSHLCSFNTGRFQHIELSQSSCLVFCSQTEPAYVA